MQSSTEGGALSTGVTAGEGGITTTMVPRQLALDMTEQEDKYVLSAPVPGIEPENVKVQVKDGTVTVQVRRDHHAETHTDGSGDGDGGKAADGGTYHYVEASSGMVTRTMPLPDDADENDVSAKVESGVLSVNMGKRS